MTNTDIKQKLFTLWAKYIVKDFEPTKYIINRVVNILRVEYKYKTPEEIKDLMLKDGIDPVEIDNILTTNQDVT